MNSPLYLRGVWLCLYVWGLSYKIFWSSFFRRARLVVQTFTRWNTFFNQNGILPYSRLHGKKLSDYLTCYTRWLSVARRLVAWSILTLNNLRRIRKYLSNQSAQMLVHAFIIGRLDYCNSLLYGLPSVHLSKLQRVQNSAARLVCNISRYDHITPVLYSLH